MIMRIVFRHGHHIDVPVTGPGGCVMARPMRPACRALRP